MAYDYQKVQAWLARVSDVRGSSLRLWLALLEQTGSLMSVDANLRLGVPLLELVNTFYEASTWERTNMLYGLKDIVDKEMAYDIHCYAQTARREDDTRDPELQRILQARSHGSIDPATGCNSPVEKADGQGH